MTAYLQDADVTSCVEFTGYRGRDGYGRVHRRAWGSPRLAHRVAWEQAHGPIAEGAQIDHLCENKACVNVAHLALRDSDRDHKRAHAARRTHCRRGHAYAEHGREHRDGSGRYCRACERNNERRRAALSR